MRATIFSFYVLCSLPLAVAQDLFIPSEISTLPKKTNVSKAVDKASVANRRAGVLYSVWHVMAANNMRTIANRGGEPLTVEKVLQSNGEKTLDDILKKYGFAGDIFNVEPAELGFYCLYKKRIGDPPGGTPECANTKEVARRHAELLIGAGFDYIYLDLTNWAKATHGVDVTILRPVEVLMDHWLELRAEGTPTPDVVAWTRTSPDSYDDGTGAVWKWALDSIYNHPERKTLIWRRPSFPDKMVWMVTTPAPNRDADVEAKIEDNYGAGDIGIISVWTSFSGANFHAQEMWGFFSVCTHGPRRAPTTSMVGTPDVLGDCNQWCTKDSDHTSDVEISAAPGYMLSQSGLPYGQTGKLRGLVLHRTFKKVLTKGADNLIMSSFNEHIGGRQHVASTSPMAFNQGLPNDPQKDLVWVDTYGTEYSRDIEPSVEGGDLIYRVTKSCVLMYKAGRTCEDEDASEELCCTTEDKLIWNNVWSLQGTANPNKHALTTKSTDRANWIASHNWVEVCNPINGPSVFCYKANTDGRNGPFMTYNIPDAKEETLPLNLCWDGSFHFPSNDPDCEGASVAHELGYVSTTRGGETLRELQRCKHPDGGWTHSLDIPCLEGWDLDGSLGYVK